MSIESRITIDKTLKAVIRGILTSEQARECIQQLKDVNLITSEEFDKELESLAELA